MSDYPHRAVAQWADHDPSETRTKGKVSIRFHSHPNLDRWTWVVLEFKVELIFLGPSQ